ncbi:HEAT repeat domain-containing protein [Occallatibacter savannae]|uniref:HEAT repeat domain-containing protein n=1 Tax=Occallatibacter savannae TaxID=1002691 RepID=UPI0013A5B6EF|nr:HEAT repeat domain-containing protein [Occallatibacter savannae]
MRTNLKDHAFKLWAIVPLAIVGLFIGEIVHVTRAVEAGASIPSKVRTIELGVGHTGFSYALTVAVKDPAELQAGDAIAAILKDARGEIDRKWLHPADLDFYLTLRPRTDGPLTVTLASSSGSHLPDIATALARVPEEAAASIKGPKRGVVAAGPNGTWQNAQPFELGQTIFGGDDQRPYSPAPNEDRYKAMLRGFQWFRFTYRGKGPRLVYFVLNVTDRDVPLDVDIFHLGKGNDGTPDVVPYSNGEFVYRIEATQNYPGLYKFRTRILEPGREYYVRVAANHPAFQLHTYEYGVPPYTDPHLAVRSGMDFLINMGDTWLSNTPRRGAVALRTVMQHSETQLCIACHPSQFTTRGYLRAVENGYAPTQRPALEFLTDRIYNNTRPLYGEPGANWVRVIYTARTVASRLPMITRQFEENVTHDAPRQNFDVPYAQYLKIHYKGLTKMPGDEPDGCEPDVSPFEIADQSWHTFDMVQHQTHDESWRAERDHVERLALDYEPKNLIDVAWEVMMLSEIGRKRYSGQIDKLIAKAYEYENAEGGWPYQFDKKAKPADFISYNMVLALAEAGRRPETDAHMALAVKAMLAAQRPEGSWEGDPVYQGFNTPFRATQFAVMALSTLYPGATKEKNWNAGNEAPVSKLDTSDLPLLLEQLDQFWDLAPEPVLSQIRHVLVHSDQPLAREAAARALGHMADPGALPDLMKALGDQTKMVQTSAAYAIRMILSRRTEAAPAGRTMLIAALRSGDARTRWGAARVFNQHFRDLTGDVELLRALEDTLNDPVPYVRFEAAAGIWRWYYWQVDRPEMRRTTLESLAVRMNTETDPMVRRGLEESIYDLLDENTGYLSAWVRTSGTNDDKERIENGYEQVVRDQAQVLARVLRNATPLGRKGILNALWDFHIRHYALPKLKGDTVSIGLPAVLTKYVPGVPDLHREGYEYPPYREAVDFTYDVNNGFYQTRIGNDSDLIHFFKSSGPELEDALLQCLKNADDPIKIEVLKAGSTLSEAGDARFTLAALNLSQDPNSAVRDTVRYVYEGGRRGILKLDSSDTPNPDLVRKVIEILKHGTPESQAVVLPLLAALPTHSAWTRETALREALSAMLAVRPQPSNYAQLLFAASSFPSLMNQPALQEQALEALNSSNPDVRRAAVDIALEHFLTDPAVGPALKSALSKLSPVAQRTFLDEVANPEFLKKRLGLSGGAVSQDQDYLNRNAGIKQPRTPLEYPLVVDAVMDDLLSPDANVSAAALDTLGKIKQIDKRPEFRSAMEKLNQSRNPRLKLIATRVLEGKDLHDALRDVEPGSVLDFRFFESKVEPILAARGPDGLACVFCHSNHVIFKLQPPNAQGAFSDQDSEENYKYAMRVVNVTDPAQSLILIKPTRPTDSAGDVGDYLATHNGGQRWQLNQKSREYQTILEWIRGARMETAASDHRSASNVKKQSN